MKFGSSISALEIEQERTVAFMYALSGPLYSKILLHANKRYTKGVPFMLKMVYTMWHEICARVYFCGLAIFCVLRELIFAKRTDWFFQLGINCCDFQKVPSTRH